MVTVQGWKDIGGGTRAGGRGGCSANDLEITAFLVFRRYKGQELVSGVAYVTSGTDYRGECVQILYVAFSRSVCTPTRAIYAFFVSRSMRAPCYSPTGDRPS